MSTSRHSTYTCIIIRSLSLPLILIIITRSSTYSTFITLLTGFLFISYRLHVYHLSPFLNSKTENLPLIFLHFLSVVLHSYQICPFLTNLFFVFSSFPLWSNASTFHVSIFKVFVSFIFTFGYFSFPPPPEYKPHCIPLMEIWLRGSLPSETFSVRSIPYRKLLRNPFGSL